MSITFVFCSCFYLCILLFMHSASCILTVSRSFWKTKIFIQSPILFLITIICQWIISFILILPYLFLQDFEYDSHIKRLIAIIFVYIILIRFIRRKNRIHKRQLNTHQRDLLVVKRIIITLAIGIIVGFPTAVLLVLYMITHQITSLAYHIQALSLTGGLVVQSIALGMITPQIREIFKLNLQLTLNKWNILIYRYCCFYSI